jgi:A/G-specific adenine glycosylase
VPAEARQAVLDWYAVHGRLLAFRQTTDVYAVLVSEVMAQQTQIARVELRWHRFIQRFPTVRALAAASTADVLREWAGLGYDRRALALQRSARLIVERHGGVVPSTVDELEALPGVGPYTARAVAAIAYGRPVGAVDVNVRRVLGRLISGAAGALSTPDLQSLADRSVPVDQPARWTHALMDLGATLCRPRTPDCGNCPVMSWCRFAQAGQGMVTGSGAVPGWSDARPRPPATPFVETTRWLRGRILDRLRASPDGAWVSLDGPIGRHDPARVAGAARSMAADGVLELEDTDSTTLRARLPLG